MNHDDEETVSRNTKAEAISAQLRAQTVERIQNGDTERVDEPLATLIEDARTSS